MNVSNGMTPRERVVNAIHFRDVDVLPWYESYNPYVILRWISEGLPADKITQVKWKMEPGKIFSNRQLFAGYDLYSFFGTSNLWALTVPVDEGPVPRFKEVKIGETDRYTEYLSETGAVVRRIKGKHLGYEMPQFIDFPVRDKETWDQYKTRLNPEDPRRYPIDWERTPYEKIFSEYQDGSSILCISGFYGFGAQLMGIVNFNLAFYKTPDLISEMASFWEHFNIERLRDAVETLKGNIDLVYWWEDMASKKGPNISPKLYREYFLPHYKKVLGFLKRNKVDRIMMDSDGNNNQILDLIIEAGITGFWPLEVNADMDVRTVRKKYAEKLFLGGNLDKREIAKGGETMRKEIDSKLPLMKETGGYIAGLDHGVPYDISYRAFKEYTEYLKKNLVIT